MNTAVTHPDKPSPARAAVVRNAIARLQAHPGIKQAKVATAHVFYLMDFVTDAECAQLVDLIDRDRRPSTLLSDTGVSEFRTSESCDLDRFSPLVQPIDERIAHLLGIDPPFGETMQGQRYGPTQQFRAHHDYFAFDQPYWPRMEAEGGQRTWTAMLYLNDVAEGGATWFPQAGIRIPPKKRMLLTWSNMQDDGSPNPYTLHEGMAVTKGTKYVVTKWFREHHWYK